VTLHLKLLPTLTNRTTIWRTVLTLISLLNSVKPLFLLTLPPRLETRNNVLREPVKPNTSLTIHLTTVTPILLTLKLLRWNVQSLTLLKLTSLLLRLTRVDNGLLLERLQRGKEGIENTIPTTRTPRKTITILELELEEEEEEETTTTITSKVQNLSSLDLVQSSEEEQFQSVRVESLVNFVTLGTTTTAHLRRRPLNNNLTVNLLNIDLTVTNLNTMEDTTLRNNSHLLLIVLLTLLLLLTNIKEGTLTSVHLNRNLKSNSILPRCIRSLPSR